MTLSQALGLRTRKHRSGSCDCSLPQGHGYAKTKDAGFVGIVGSWLLLVSCNIIHFVAVGENHALTLLLLVWDCCMFF